MDYDYLPASDGNGDAALMHIMANRLTGSTSLQVDTTTHVPTKFLATAGTLLSTGFMDPATVTNFKGHTVDATHVAIDAFEPGTTDNGNTSSQVVIIKPTTGWANRVASFIKNATGLGTPENHTVAALTASSIHNTGNTQTDGNTTVNGNIVILGTSRLATASVATVDGSGNITPSKQIFEVTALDAAATIKPPNWGALDGMTGELQVKDNGTSHNITWDPAFVPIGVTLPTTTTAGKYMYVSYRYNGADSKYHVLGIARQS